MKKLVNAYKKLSYRKKVFAGLIAAALIPVVICFIGVFISFKVTNEKKLADDAEVALAGAESIVAGTCEKINLSLHQIANAPATERMLKDNDSSSLVNVYRMLYSSVTDVNRHADFAIYDMEGTLKLYTGDRSLTKNTLSTNWGILYELAVSPDSEITRAGRLYHGTNKDVLLRIGQAVIDEDGRLIGYVIAQITESNFSDLLKYFGSDKLGEVYITDGFMELVYSSSMIEDSMYTEALNELSSGLTTKHIRKDIFKGRTYYSTEDKNTRYYYIFDSKDNLHLMYRQQVEPYIVMSDSLLVILSIAAILSIIVALLVSRNLSLMFYRPIRRMSDGMEKIKQGNFEVEIEVENDDELGRLSGMFNDMSSKLTDNMNQLVNREKELSDANIKMMQAQLNPHFIYNTLDTMKWIGKDAEIPEVATLSSGLADIMRASISSGQTVTLKKEIELVESYASIQQIRFNDKFEFLTDISDDLLDCEVPKLILQPIVENAILHGLKNRDYGQVLISGIAVKSDADFSKFNIDKSAPLYSEIPRPFVVLSIKDDGIGIDDDTASKLNNHEQLAKGSNIGFHNVDSIIRLHYGEKYGLHISKCETGGTEVRFLLPYIKLSTM